jgi:tRNA A-37 threonylcarbamoyl transferase component Bud32
MTEPARPARDLDNTEDEPQHLDQTLARPEGEIVLATQKPELEPDFGPPEKPGEVGTLGRYRVLKRIGRGGMGAVYLAFDTVLARRIALKVMLPEHAAHTEARERFLREARTAAMVRSDHVVLIFDVGQERGVPFIAMEYLLGHPLDQYLRVTGELPLAQVFRIGCETALGLAAAHDLGLVHRDVKPGNVWLEAPHGRVKLLDFGLARAENDDTHLTSSGAVVGTPAFMSPEQARGLKLDGRSDLFSLGVMLYRLATGKMPFTGDTTMAVLTSLAVDAPTPVRQFKADAPEWLEAIIAKLLAKNPADRFQTALEVVAALRAAEQPRAAPGVLPVGAQAVPMAIPEQPESVWAEIELSVSGPQLLESATAAPASGSSVARRKTERKVSKWPAVVACAGLLIASAILAAVLLWPSKGVLIVESDDPNAELVVRMNGAIVRDRTKDREIQLRPGNYTVELAVPGAGLRLSPDKFEITEKNRARVRVIAEKVKPPGAKPTPPTDPDRRAAEYLLSVGGVVSIAAGGEQFEVKSATDLPKQPFSVVVFNASRNPKVTDEGLAAARDCKHIAHLYVNESPHITDRGLMHFAGSTDLLQIEAYDIEMTDQGLAAFKDTPNLTRLSINHTKVTDAGLALFKEHTKLVFLGLGDLEITDAGLAHFKGQKKLSYLDVHNTKVTDAGLEPFKECPALTWLYVHGTKVTPAKVAEFAQALPRCRIVWDGGTIEPKK